MKKATYFYACLVLSLSESLELKYSKNTQAEANSWPEKTAAQKSTISLMPPNLGYYNGNAGQLS